MGGAWTNWLSVIARKKGNWGNIQISDLATGWRVVCFLAPGSAGRGADQWKRVNWYRTHSLKPREMPVEMQGGLQEKALMEGWSAGGI